MNVLKQLTELLIKSNSEYKKKKQKQKKYMMLQKQYAYVSYGQLHMQNALGTILRESTISNKLCKITYVTDLVPSGFQVSDTGTTYYYFTWSKVNPDEVFSITLCERIKNKINSSITNSIKRYAYVYSTLDENMKTQFIMDNPAFYNGFYVVNCTDDTDEIILTLAYN